MSEKGILAGLLLFVLVVLPILIIRDVRDRRKIRKILQSHQQDRRGSRETTSMKSQKAKGWGMNNSPFRSRKSGLTWGGGNVHASHARRGKRRKTGP